MLTASRACVLLRPPRLRACRPQALTRCFLCTLVLLRRRMNKASELYLALQAARASSELSEGSFLNRDVKQAQMKRYKEAQEEKLRRRLEGRIGEHAAASCIHACTRARVVPLRVHGRKAL